MTDYVAGFLIDESRELVALVQKNRPEWQAGKLNGIGGHIEEGESPDEAMHREFEEETGIVFKTDWNLFCVLTGDWGRVFFFRRFAPKDFIARSIQQKTDESILFVPLRSAVSMALPNLSWLLPLAAYTHDNYEPIVVTEKSINEEIK